MKWTIQILDLSDMLNQVQSKFIIRKEDGGIIAGVPERAGEDLARLIASAPETAAERDSLRIAYDKSLENFKLMTAERDRLKEELNTIKNADPSTWGTAGRVTRMTFEIDALKSINAELLQHLKYASELLELSGVINPIIQQSITKAEKGE